MRNRLPVEGPYPFMGILMGNGNDALAFLALRSILIKRYCSCADIYGNNMEPFGVRQSILAITKDIFGIYIGKVSISRNANQFLPSFPPGRSYCRRPLI